MRLFFIPVILIALSLCAGPVCAGGSDQKPPVPEDFAYGLPIQTDGESALIEIVLPIEFYQGITRGDQGDACVFNGRKEVVPHAIQLPKDESVPAPVVQMPVFRVAGEPGRGLENLSLNVRRDTTGAVIHLDTIDKQPQDQTAAYILDISALEKPVKALEFEWEPTPNGFVGKIDLEGSNDLEHWFRLVSGAAIAGLSYGEYSLMQKKVSFVPAKIKYIRISWPPALQQITLVKAAAELLEGAVEQPRNRLSVDATAKRDQPGEYEFTSPGAIPVDRIRIKLPQKNTLVSAAIFSKEDTGSAWKPRLSGLIYDLRMMGEDLVSADLSLPPTTDRYWMMRVQQTGGGLGQGMPQIEFGWISQRLLFVARGNGPFLLAVGNARSAPLSARMDSLLTQFTDQRQGKVSAQVVSTGPRIELGGEARLKAPPPQFPWGKWILAVILVLAVLLLAAISLRLWRQMSRQQGNGS
jgi:hypothetical protein